MFDVDKYKDELNAICDFTEIYEKFRLVDPTTKEIFTIKNGKAVRFGDTPCYKIWNRDAPCENCISLRTCRDESRYFKLENLGPSILMIVSKPVKVEEKLFSLELVSNVTNSMVIQEEGTQIQTSIVGLVSEVNRLSIRDMFSGLYNNNFIKNRITELVCGDNLQPFSIMVMDIDRFKLVNDNYGHMVGDVVIQTIATQLSTFFAKPGSYVGRMGGDEYCVVLSNCTLRDAEEQSALIAEQIQSHIYMGRDNTFSVDISIGIGQYMVGEKAYDFIDRVDRNLYEVKNRKN